MKGLKEAENGTGKTVDDHNHAEKEDGEDEDDGTQKMFKVVIENPSPESVKISRKN